MASLFRDIRGFFDAKYSGRYFALILRELASHEPRLFGRIFRLGKAHFPTKANGLELIYEWKYEGAKRADLALLDGGRPIMLVEIKVEDILSAKNPDQLAGYIEFAKSFPIGERPKLAYVSRYAPSETLQRVLEKNSSLVLEIRFREILERLNEGCGPVGEMVKDYLEDSGVASYKMISLNEEKGGKVLAFALVQMLGFPHFHGLGKLSSFDVASAVPELMGVLTGNLGVIGDWVRSENRELFSAPFTRKFRPRPIYDQRTLRRAMEEGDSWVGGATSGSVYYYCYGKMKTGDGRGDQDWIYVELGYLFSIETKNREIDLRLYSGFFGKDFEAVYHEKKLTVFPDEKKALSILRALLAKALDEVKGRPAKASQKRALKSFKLPPLA